MAIQHQLWQENEFRSKLAEAKRSAQNLWALVTALCVDAVMRYHQHSKDSSRVQRVWDMLDEANLRSHQSAFHSMIRQTTGITKIGEADGEWKTNDRKFSQIEDSWQEVVEDIEDLGLDVWDKKERGERQQTSSGTQRRQTQRAPTLKLPSETDEGTANAVQVMLDRVMGSENPRKAIQAVQQALKGELPEGGEAPVDERVYFEDKRLRTLFNQFRTHLVQLENQTDAVMSRASGELETGVDKAIRALTKADEAVCRMLTQDFGVDLGAVITAAEEEAEPEATEAEPEGDAEEPKGEAA